MTRKSTLLSHLALTCMLLLLSFGCETRAVTMEIPGFGNANIEGVWIWRLSESTGHYVRACRLELYDSQLDESGKEVVPYLQLCDAPDQIGFDLKATIARLPSDPDTIVLTMWYFRFDDAGQFKASSYNSTGESPLSATTLSL
jgi:hypothetical protein